MAFNRGVLLVALLLCASASAKVYFKEEFDGERSSQHWLEAS